MPSFNLKIVTPYGVHYEGEAEAITVRTVTGDVSIWPNHSNTVTALDVGRCSVVINGEKRVGVCNRGLLNVTKNNVEVLAATFEWKEDIDLERAQSELERRKKELADAKDEKSIARAKIRVKRELIRTQVKTENDELSN